MTQYIKDRLEYFFFFNYQSHFPIYRQEWTMISVNGNQRWYQKKTIESVREKIGWNQNKLTNLVTCHGKDW